MPKCKIYPIESFWAELFRENRRSPKIQEFQLTGGRPPKQGCRHPLLGDHNGITGQEHYILFHSFAFENFLIVELQTIFPAVLRP